MTRSPEEHGDYRFFRFLAVATARFTVAGLFFILWALLFAKDRFGVAVFLGNTTLILLLVSLVSAGVSYGLFKRRGGVVEKGPRSPEELAGASETSRDG